MIIGNDIDNNKEVATTDYFETELAKKGLVYLSYCNGCIRMFIPELVEKHIPEMKTGKEIVISVSAKTNQIEIMFDDSSEAPFCINISKEMIDFAIWKKSHNKQVDFYAYTEDLKKVIDTKCYMRIVPSIPCRQPFNRNDKILGLTADGRLITEERKYPLTVEEEARQIKLDEKIMAGFEESDETTEEQRIRKLKSKVISVRRKVFSDLIDKIMKDWWENVQDVIFCEDLERIDKELSQVARIPEIIYDIAETLGAFNDEREISIDVGIGNFVWNQLNLDYDVGSEKFSKELKKRGFELVEELDEKYYKIYKNLSVYILENIWATYTKQGD